MDITEALIVISILYGLLYFLNTIFKSCAHYPYYQFLKGTGLEIKLLQIRWTTTAFNRLLLRWGNAYTKFYNLWFTVGMYVTLILLPISITLLLVAVVQNFTEKSDKGSIIEPVIPGVNLPASEMGYYSLGLVVCSVVHEVGHALAAVREDVHLVNVGFNLIFILPIAWVNLSSEKLLSLHAWKQLKIFCAGIWHNVVLALIIYLLYLSTPLMFSSLFNVGAGVFVTHVHKSSPLLGNKGIFVRDIVTKINDCVVQTENDWFDCLYKLKRVKPGLCVSTDLVHELDESIHLKQLSNGIYDCCGSGKPDKICFEYLDNDNGVLEIPPHVCLPARIIVDNSPEFCDMNNHCSNMLHCIKPMLDNNTNLLVINREGNKNIVYIGHSSDLLATMKISPFVPTFFFTTTQLPDAMMKMMMYLVIFNIGFAIVNVLPCMFMDGQYITNCVIHLLLGKHFKNAHTINALSLITSLIGMFLLVSHCVYITSLRIFAKY